MLQEERRLHTRQKIMQSTVEILRRNSLDELRLDDLVRESNLSRPTIYNHFDSQQHILSSVGHELLLSWGLGLVDHDRWRGNAGTRLRHLYRTLAKEIKTHRRTWLAIMFSGAFHIEPMVSGRKHIDGYISAIISNGQARGEISRKHQADSLANLLSAMQTTVCNDWAMSYPRRESLVKRLTAGLDLFLHGVASR